jgi:hypothetical protein
MTNDQKRADRDRRSRAYQELVRALAGISDVYCPTASSIFDCLSKAHLSEEYAISSGLSREELFREDRHANVPEELSDNAISVSVSQNT